MKYALIALLIFLSACHANTDYLIRTEDSVSGKAGYVNVKGDTIIPPGKYSYCYTDTFKNFAIVSKENTGIIGINRKEEVLYNVFIYDNGPDYLAEGYFRILKNNKMGYADSNGNIVIKPIYGCALPFEKGIAKAGMDCKIVRDGDEHWHWESNEWFYINKAGQRVK